MRARRALLLPRVVRARRRHSQTRSRPPRCARRSLDAFDICAKLYAGHISSVYRAIDKKSGITVGLKLYKRAMLNDMERHQIAREIWLHIQLNHPSIIALYAAWKDKDYIYLVLEWAPEGNVFTFLQQNGGRLPESVVVPMILEPTMSALHYIHELVSARARALACSKRPWRCLRAGTTECCCCTRLRHKLAPPRADRRAGAAPPLPLHTATGHDPPGRQAGERAHHHQLPDQARRLWAEHTRQLRGRQHAVRRTATDAATGAAACQQACLSAAACRCCHNCRTCALSSSTSPNAPGWARSTTCPLRSWTAPSSSTRRTTSRTRSAGTTARWTCGRWACSRTSCCWGARPLRR